MHEATFSALSRSPGGAILTENRDLEGEDDSSLVGMVSATHDVDFKASQALARRAPGSWHSYAGTCVAHVHQRLVL